MLLLFMWAGSAEQKVYIQSGSCHYCAVRWQVDNMQAASKASVTADDGLFATVC